MTVETRYVAIPLLNERAGPGTTYAITGRLARNLMVTVIGDNIIVANGYHWVERAKYRGRWLALEYLSVAPGSVPSPAGELKIGIHLSMRNYDPPTLLRTLSTMATRGRPCPLVLALGPDDIPISQLLTASPQTTVVSRVWPGGGGGLDMTAAQYFALNVLPFPERRRAHYHQITNEPTDWSATALQWWLDQMRWAESQGFRLALPTPSTGTPELDVWQRQGTWQFLRYIRDHGHLLALHEYFRGDLDWELFRFTHRAFPLLPIDLRTNMPKVAFTEWGMQGGRYINYGDWLTFLRAGQLELAKYPWVVGTATWAIGDTGNTEWYGDNWVANLQALQEV